VDEQFNLGVYLLDRHVAEGRGAQVAVYYGSSSFNVRGPAAL